MFGLKTKIDRFMRDEEGQSTTEYILILAVVVMIALKFKKQIGDVITNATDKINDDITNTLNN
jgi:pilus assembly protein Flp/PilA